MVIYLVKYLLSHPEVFTVSYLCPGNCIAPEQEYRESREAREERKVGAEAQEVAEETEENGEKNAQHAARAHSKLAATREARRN